MKSVRSSGGDVVVDGRTSLARLHHFIQAAFGWTDAHLHEFTINETRYMEPHPEEITDDIETRDERKGYLNRLLADGDTFVYLYDFGDGWSHNITVEEIEMVGDDPHGDAYVAGGERACPPEDVGGQDRLPRVSGNHSGRSPFRRGQEIADLGRRRVQSRPV